MPVLRALLAGRHDAALDHAAYRKLLQIDHRGRLTSGRLRRGQQTGIGQCGDDQRRAGRGGFVAADFYRGLASAAHGQAQHQAERFGGLPDADHFGFDLLASCQQVLHRLQHLEGEILCRYSRTCRAGRGQGSGTLDLGHLSSNALTTFAFAALGTWGCHV